LGIRGQVLFSNDNFSYDTKRLKIISVTAHGRARYFFSNDTKGLGIISVTAHVRAQNKFKISASPDKQTKRNILSRHNQPWSTISSLAWSKNRILIYIIIAFCILPWNFRKIVGVIV